MTHSTRNLGVAALIAAVLVALVLWVGRRSYLAAPPALTPLAPEAVRRIRLDIPPVAAQVFERRADGWWRIEPSAARADDARVARLAKLAATPVARWIPAAKITPANVGLAHPSATLVVNGRPLEYGGLSAIGHLRYVRVGDRIALVPRQYSPEVVLTRRNRK
jgi:hypothetical protein